MTETLLDRVRRLLLRARRELPDDPAGQVLTAALERLDEPLRVAIAGKLKAGKSTLLNAMVGEELAPTDAGECTRVITWYRDGPTYRVTLHVVDGPPEPRPFDRVAGAIRVRLDRPVAEVDHLEVEVPSRRLREHTLIDTPGVASLSTDVSLRTAAFLSANPERPGGADAVVYLMRHMHGDDVRFLEAFHGGDLVRSSPVNAVGVLSRADEIGGCRLDAMAAAGRVAARYQRDPRLRRLCPVIVPVAGLLAAAGATLREAEFRALTAVAARTGEELSELLLTADRFAAAAPDLPVPRFERQLLLERLGLFGVRLSVQRIRSGAARTSGDLARELSAHSGLADLRRILAAQFLDRGRVLKARSALATLGGLLRARPAGEAPAAAASSLAAEAEEIVAGAHEIVEVRLLHLLRSGRVAGRPEHLAALERVIGGAGIDPGTRLGLPGDASDDRLTAAAEEALARWRRLAEHPLTARDLRYAARAAARSCEGILAGQRAAADRSDRTSA